MVYEKSCSEWQEEEMSEEDVFPWIATRMTNYPTKN